MGLYYKVAKALCASVLFFTLLSIPYVYPTMVAVVTTDILITANETHNAVGTPFERNDHELFSNGSTQNPGEVPGRKNDPDVSMNREDSLKEASGRTSTRTHAQYQHELENTSVTPQLNSKDGNINAASNYHDGSLYDYCRGHPSAINNNENTTLPFNRTYIHLTNANLKFRQNIIHRRHNCQEVDFSSENLPLTALVSVPGSGNTWARHLIELITGRNQYMPRLARILRQD